MNYKYVIKKQSFIITLSILIMTIVLIGTSYALFNQVDESSNNQTVTIGTLTINYSTTSTTTTGDVNPTTEMEVAGYNIALQNNGTLPMEYNVTVYTDDDNQISHDLIKIKLDDENEVYLNELEKTEETEKLTGNAIRYILKSDVIAAKDETGDNKNYVVKAWIDDLLADDTINNKKISVKVKIDGIVAESERNGYYYWRDTNTYASTKAPDTVYEDYSSLVTTGVNSTLIRTKYVNDNPVSHAACLYYNDRLFCLEYGYWKSIIGNTESNTDNAKIVQTNLKRDIGYALDSRLKSWTASPASTSVNLSQSPVIVCSCSARGGAYCYSKPNRCNVNDDGSANCT